MRHPSTAVEFEWDDDDDERGNTAKLAKRDVWPRDVEDVFWSRPRWQRNKRTGTATWTMTGSDRRGRGLKIAILWADELDGTLRAIAAWPVPKGAP